MDRRRPQSPVISPVEIREALLRSGYLTETRVAQLLREAEYQVEHNRPFPDPTSGKSREIDVYAKSIFEVGWGEKGRHSLTIEMIVECVHPPQPVVFVLKDTEAEYFAESRAMQLVRVLGAPLHVHPSDLADNWRFAIPHLDLESVHHYANGRIATQFCSFEQKKSGEWLATHRDADHEAFRSICIATEHVTGLYYQTDDIEEMPERLTLSVFYPVMVVEGKLFEAIPGKRGLRLRTANAVKYWRTVIHDGLAKDYMIDVVTESYFTKYRGMIEREVEMLGERLTSKETDVLNMLANERRAYLSDIKPELLRRFHFEALRAAREE